MLGSIARNEGYIMIEAIVLVLIIKANDHLPAEYAVGPIQYSTEEACAADGERALIEIERSDPDALGYWCVPQSMAERFRRMNGVSL